MSHWLSGTLRWRRSLGVHLTFMQTSSDDNTVVIMKAQQRLHSLCRLKKVDLPILVLTIFHRGTINWRRNRELLRKLLPHILPHIQDI